MADYSMHSDRESQPKYQSASSTRKMVDPYGKNFGRDCRDEPNEELADAKKEYSEPVHRLRYEFVLLVESLNVDFETKYVLMKAIDDVLERHGLDDE